MVFRDNTRRPVCSYGKVLYCLKPVLSSESTHSERLFKRYFLNVKLYYYFSTHSFVFRIFEWIQNNEYFKSNDENWK